jgi:hypothetical protein
MDQQSRQERLRVVLVVVAGCIVSPLLQVGGQILLSRLWWSRGLENAAYPLEHTAGYTHLLMFVLFPAMAFTMGLASGVLIGRMWWPPLVMMWPLFLSLALSYPEYMLTALILGFAYGIIAIVAVRVGALIRRTQASARAHSQIS